MGIQQFLYAKYIKPLARGAALFGLTLGLAGCAQSNAADAADHTVSETETAKESSANGPVLNPYEGPRWLTTPEVDPQARKAVEIAVKAYQDKKWDKVGEQIEAAQEDPVLGHYPEYWWLMRQLEVKAMPVREAALQRYIDTHADTYLAERLKGDWAVAAARVGDFQRILDLDPPTFGRSDVFCAQAHAMHMGGLSLDRDAVMREFRPNEVCWGLMDQLWADDALSWSQLQLMLRGALEQGKTTQARRTAAIMFNGKQMQDYTALMENPRRWLGQQSAPAGAQERELLTLALSRLARNDDRETQAKYIEERWQQALTPEDMDWVWSQFGLVPALRVEPDAARWYRKTGSTPKTDYNHAWEVRAELREYPINWEQVLEAINKMSERQASEPVWVYWRGRALAALGDQQAAEEAFTSIQNDFSFYGQLALEELGTSITAPAAAPAIDPLAQEDVRQRPGLNRALALFKLGLRPEATREWVNGVRDMSDQQLRAAAQWAGEEGVFDRVVNTSLLTQDEVDFDQRFVAPFFEGVSAQSERINLDPAWVYGLIRQESRFMTDARSRVGASGLMQLMPDTAKWVANKIDMKGFSMAQIDDFEVNTVLGTNYLKIVLDQLGGSEVLASAGYNAGPGRPKQWRARLRAPVEGAVFAETIPFTETRLYVKNVLSNTAYYAAMFEEQPQSLKTRLGTVTPQ
ncbi:MAG TPA: transglycosylase SLT domain-containing protein [Paenalcaligenes sp.]|nr:transglycosylase SLT domain-containing protein [Paenalcaligenes sp.]